MYASAINHNISIASMIFIASCNQCHNFNCSSSSKTPLINLCTIQNMRLLNGWTVGQIPATGGFARTQVIHPRKIAVCVALDIVIHRRTFKYHISCSPPQSLQRAGEVSRTGIQRRRKIYNPMPPH